MEWNKLLKLERFKHPDYIQKEHRSAYMQDIDRILFSPPFRRLANKTQVHPLYDNDHLHHRLIHSLEVASVGRSLGIGVGAWLADKIDNTLKDQIEVIAGLVQTACMAHDIGNPPFGHSGEEAIAAWFREKFALPKGIFADITENCQAEFEAFEGNAQGFRILTRTEMYRDEGGMRLTLGALGAFTKYPLGAPACNEMKAARRSNDQLYIGAKKYGLFFNDIENFHSIAHELDLPEERISDPQGKHVGSLWHRHPLAFLMEAADDICYNIMDLEDAYLSGDLAFDDVISLLKTLFPKPNQESIHYNDADIVARLRAQAINHAIGACIEAFKANYLEIMSGVFSDSLVEVSSLKAEFADIKRIARQRIFNAPRKTELEVYGRNVIYRVLDGLLPLLSDLRNANWDTSQLSSYHLQLIRGLNFPIRQINTSYDALHALTDYVSGMTDRYTVKVADMIGRR